MLDEKRSFGPPPSPGAVSRVTGYVVLWDVPSPPMPKAPPVEGGPSQMFVEVFRRGCFRQSILRSDIIATINGETIGCKAHGELRVWEDEKGLAYEMRVPNGVNHQAMIEAPTASLVFRVRGQKSDAWVNGGSHRDIIDVDLISVGISLQE